MDLTQLEMFNAVAEAGSITQAAAKVHRVPSNLTTRLRQLETELGVDLFIRENQRLRLSPAGHNFLRYSQQILALVDEARSVVAGDEPQGLFSLGSLESTAAVRIPATLAEFNRRYPKIQFSLSTGPSGTMLEGVLEGKLNAAFIDGPINHTAIDGIPVYREELMIVTPQGHAPVIRASQVNGSNIYAFRANCSYRRHFESWFHADGAAPGTIHEMESYHGMLACVVAGAGIALIPRSMLESMPGHHQVEAWPLAEQWRWLTTWLVWRRGAKTRPLEAFIQLLDVPDSAKQGYQIREIFPRLVSAFRYFAFPSFNFFSALSAVIINACILQTLFVFLIFADLLVNRKDFTLRAIYHFYVSGHLLRPCTDCNVLAFLDNIHQLVIIISLDGGFKGADFRVQTKTLDVGNRFVHDADGFFAGCHLG